eukprot:GHVS01017703.1.p2 GENE.GHVS01017703.1~~GHVS01017703.1.p2  ORF type:complete len:224 (+),score=49.07 GHVS01017703.1:1842-2513(+)
MYANRGYYRGGIGGYRGRGGGYRGRSGGSPVRQVYAARRSPFVKNKIEELERTVARQQQELNDLQRGMTGRKEDGGSGGDERRKETRGRAPAWVLTMKQKQQQERRVRARGGNGRGGEGKTAERNGTKYVEKLMEGVLKKLDALKEIPQKLEAFTAQFAVGGDEVIVGDEPTDLLSEEGGTHLCTVSSPGNCYTSTRGRLCAWSAWPLGVLLWLCWYGTGVYA